MNIKPYDGDFMIIHLSEERLQRCKDLVQEVSKKRGDFREIGGYLIGAYDGNFQIREFLLDTLAESTATRIKLSAECFHRVEEILASNPDLFYIGTWHVHPGKSKPVFSSTDTSTLFLERLVIETDNPKEFQCPRIHLILSEDLTQISAYTLQISMDYHVSDYWDFEKKVTDDDLHRVDELIQNLEEVKASLKKYMKNQDLEVIEWCFSELGTIRDELDQLMDLIEEVSDFQEIYSILYDEKKNIEKQLKASIKTGETLGILALNENNKIEFIKYRPQLIKEHHEDGTLLGFWKHFSISQPPLEFQEIFFANFFRKLDANADGGFLYILSDPTEIKFYHLKMTALTGISFGDIQIVSEEMS